MSKVRQNWNKEGLGVGILAKKNKRGERKNEVEDKCAVVKP